jgi:hypothetical protein
MNRDLLKARLGKLPHLPPLTSQDEAGTVEDDEQEELLDSFPTDSSSTPSLTSSTRSK